MAKAPLWHANERVDKNDQDHATIDFPRALRDQANEILVLDRQSRVIRGFRVELAVQATFPGRITIHGGSAYDLTGRPLFNADQLDVSRTITLSGSNSVFWVEIEFTETDSDVDSRAFWDATVDQGADPSGDLKPDGQEFNNNVATRQTPDWKVVFPIRTGTSAGFTRDAPGNANSIKIPIIRLATDGGNQITAAVTPGLTTENPATTLLEATDANHYRVVNAQLFQNGGSVILGEGLGTQETVTVVTVDRQTNILEITAPTNSHVSGEIIRETGGSARDFVVEATYGRYRRQAIWDGGGTVIDYRDRLWQGDELHGSALSLSQSGGRGDVNLQSLKDHIDFLSAQLHEMKWGQIDPYTGPIDALRTPPGVDGNGFPSTPRYYDRAPGMAGGKSVTITVGDGTNSFGDFNAANEEAIQAAHDNLPAAGGTIVIKRGVYAIGATAGLDFNNTGKVTVIAEDGAILESNGGFYCFVINTTGELTLKNLVIRRGASELGINITTNNPAAFKMEGCKLENAAMNIDAVLIYSSFIDCRWVADHANMSGSQLIIATVNGAISGRFDNCIFQHDTATALTGVTFNMFLGAMAFVEFNNCQFYVVSGAGNTDNVHLGAITTKVTFSQCSFSGVATIAHIRCIGGTDLNILNCTQLDSFAAGMGITEVDRINVDSWVHGDPSNSFCLFGLEFNQCNQIKVINCDLRINGIADLTYAGIVVRGVGVGKDVSGVIIANNIIEGSITAFFDNAVGILINMNNGNVANGIVIEGNRIKNCECGIAFLDSDSSVVVYTGVTVTGNVVEDTGVAISTANNMKIGIYQRDPNAQLGQWTVTGNVVTNCNPGVSTLLAGDTRRGIDLQGVLNDSVVSNNVINNVGNAGFNLSGTYGIKLSNAFNTVVTGNTVSDVNGIDVAGIMLSDGATSDNLSVNANIISGMTSTSGVCAGIQAYDLTDSTLGKNSISGMTTGSGTGAGIYSNNLATGNFLRCTVVGNRVDGAAAFALIRIRAQTQIDNVFKGNSGASGLYYGIILESAVGGAVRNITITGNTITCTSIALTPNWASNLTSTACKKITVTGNVFTTTGVDFDGVVMSDCSYWTLTGNTIESTAIPTVFTHNIYAQDSSEFIISSNILIMIDDAQSRGIELAATCIHFNIIGNIIDQGLAGGASVSIVTGASGVGANQAFVYGNLASQASALAGNEAGFTQVAPSPGGGIRGY